jgi:S-adenosyl methyltransferase
MTEGSVFKSLVRDEAVPVRDIDTSIPHIARMYDYWLGGKDNFAADRAAAKKAAEKDPRLLAGVRGNRAFLARSVRFLAAGAGIRQFLDIGTGIPSADNTHEVAQAAAPGSRVVYVDNDPIVLAHARALLTGTASVTAYIDADARNPREILAAAGRTLDFSKPVGLMLIGLLHCIPDDDDPWAIVRTLLDAIPAGSYLAISHPSHDFYGELSRTMVADLNSAMKEPLTFRGKDAVLRFFDGVTLIDPGLVRVPDWRPDCEEDRANPAAVWGGVGRKQ